MDLHRTKPVLVCRGHAVYMSKLVVGHEAVFGFLRQNLPNISLYIDSRFSVRAFRQMKIARNLMLAAGA